MGYCPMGGERRSQPDPHTAPKSPLGTLGRFWSLESGILEFRCCVGWREMGKRGSLVKKCDETAAMRAAAGNAAADSGPWLGHMGGGRDSGGWGKEAGGVAGL